MEPTSQNALNQILSESSGKGVLFGLSAWGLAVGLIVSTVGYFYFRHGKQNSDFFTLGTGMALMVFPYFVTNTLYVILVASAIILFHYFSDR